MAKLLKKGMKKAPSCYNRKGQGKRGLVSNETLAN